MFNRYNKKNNKDYKLKSTKRKGLPLVLYLLFYYDTSIKKNISKVFVFTLPLSLSDKVIFIKFPIIKIFNRSVIQQSDNFSMEKQMF